MRSAGIINHILPESYPQRQVSCLIAEQSFDQDTVMVDYKPRSTLACKLHNSSPIRFVPQIIFINTFHQYVIYIWKLKGEAQLSSKLEKPIRSSNRTFTSPFPPLDFSSSKMILTSIKRYLKSTPKSISWSIRYIIMYFKKVSYFKQIPGWNTLELNYYQFWSCKNWDEMKHLSVSFSLGKQSPWVP